MKTLLKLLLALLLLLALGLGALVLLIDPNDFKDDIRAQVAEATGRELTIEGDLGLAFFPRLRIELNGASLAEATGFGDEPFVRVRKAEMQARLLPLLSGRLEVDAIQADGLAVRLIRDAQGRGNWEDIGRASPPGTAAKTGAAKDEPAASPTPPSEPAAPAKPGAAPAAETGPTAQPLTLGRLELGDVQLTWEDRRGGAHLTLSGLALTAGPFAPGRPVSVRLSGAFAEAGGVQGQVTMEGTLAQGEGPDTFALSPLAVRLDELTLADGLKASGTLQAKLRGDLSARRYVAEDMTLQLEAAGGPLSGAPLKANVRGKLTVDLAAQTVALKGLDVHAGTLHLTGEAAGEGVLEKATFSGRLAIAPLDPRAWLHRHGLPLPATADPEALSSLALRTGWRLGAGRLDLTEIDLTLDDSRIQGSAGLVQTKTPGYRFDLVADKLDLDRYRRTAEAPRTPAENEKDTAGALTGVPGAPVPAPAETPAATPKPKPQAKPAKAAPLFPVAALRTLDLDGRLKLGTLKVAGMDLGDAALWITAKDGSLRIENEVGRFYDGRLTGRIGLNATADPPALTLAQKAAAIQVGPLLRDLADEERLSGRGDLEADLAATGQSADALKRSLSGKVAVKLANGKVKGFDLEHRILQAEAKLKGRSAPAKGPEETDFTALSASGVIAKGVLANRDLSATSTYLHATGEGRIDVADERIDYLLRPRFVNPPKGRGIKEIEDIPIPVHITGTFDRPEWEVDLGPVLKDVAKRRIERELDKGDTLRKLEERTGIKGLEQGLRGLFGR